MKLIVHRVEMLQKALISSIKKIFLNIVKNLDKMKKIFMINFIKVLKLNKT